MCLDDQMLLKALRWHLVAQVGWQGASLLTLCCFISPFFLILSLLVFKIRNQIHLRLQLGYTSWVANLSLWGKKSCETLNVTAFSSEKLTLESSESSVLLYQWNIAMLRQHVLFITTNTSGECPPCPRDRQPKVLGSGEGRAGRVCSWGGGRGTAHSLSRLGGPAKRPVDLSPQTPPWRFRH